MRRETRNRRTMVAYIPGSYFLYQDWCGIFCVYCGRPTSVCSLYIDGCRYASSRNGTWYIYITFVPRKHSYIRPFRRASHNPTPRSLQSPVLALGQGQTRSLGGRDWVHSGQLGHTRIFMRPPRPSRPDLPIRGNDQSLSPTTTKNPAVSAAADEDSDSLGPTKGAGAGVGTGAGAGAGRGADAARRRTGRMGDRSDGEDAWSCCGRTVVAAGRGCEPREPLATVRGLFCWSCCRRLVPKTKLQAYCAFAVTGILSRGYIRKKMGCCKKAVAKHASVST